MIIDNRPILLNASVQRYYKLGYQPGFEVDPLGLFRGHRWLSPVSIEA